MFGAIVGRASDGISIETRVDNTSWILVGSFYRSPAELQIPPSGQDVPRFVEVRARYLDGNTPVGNNSATVSVSTIP